MTTHRPNPTRGPSTSRRRSTALRLATAAAVLALSAVSAVGPASAAPSAASPQAAPSSPAPAAQSGGRLHLPDPTGRHAVGEVALHLIDHTRPDPWQPAQQQRELMVSVFYPASRPTGRPAPYMLPAAAAHFDSVTADDYLGLHVPAGQDWAGTATHVQQGAPVADQDGGHPVLIYSPGLGEPRTWGTTLVTDLASRGYVVVTVDSTYEAPEVQFPGGSLATMVAPGDPDAFLRKALAVRATDTSFVLDQLAVLDGGHNPDADGQPLPAGLAGALDLSAVGMFGHSLGGSAAAVTMDADHRIRAGIDMDGNLTNYDNSLMPVAQHGLDRPFLLLGKDLGTIDTGPGWQAFRANTPGWSRELKLRGAQHASFTDAEALIPQLGLTTADRTDDIGTIDPQTAIRTNEAYLAAYFDHWLRGGRGQLLDGPSAQYPDMEFVN
ncbi:dienelactone hydrolase [Kitasatospora sp. MAA4]|uniref:alpha/beta hydrolase family protein n=1 Tax=Kitasatospora sp. MAA4 TaxID=3035093 RepID=UPI0024743049|nr:Tat pathway signal protein [Kitasatospora sp. MAA4]MDH6136812.1 dienelactone hydrolase [Kitasatospora sp. MAA4]